MQAEVFNRVNSFHKKHRKILWKVDRKKRNNQGFLLQCRRLDDLWASHKVFLSREILRQRLPPEPSGRLRRPGKVLSWTHYGTSRRDLLQGLMLQGTVLWCVLIFCIKIQAAETTFLVPTTTPRNQAGLISGTSCRDQ